MMSISHSVFALALIALVAMRRVGAVTCATSVEFEGDTIDLSIGNMVDGDLPSFGTDPAGAYCPSGSQGNDIWFTCDVDGNPVWSSGHCRYCSSDMIPTSTPNVSAVANLYTGQVLALGPTVGKWDLYCDNLVQGMGKHKPSTDPPLTVRCDMPTAIVVQGTCELFACGVNEFVSNHTCQPCPAGSQNAKDDEVAGPDTFCDAGHTLVTTNIEHLTALIAALQAEVTSLKAQWDTAPACALASKQSIHKWCTQNGIV